MNALYDYAVKDIDAFCKDYADGLCINTEIYIGEQYVDDQYVDARDEYWVIRCVDKSVDFPYAICIMENDGTLSEVDYCNQGRIQEWLQKDIIRPTTPDDFIVNKHAMAYLEGLRRINIYIDYTMSVEKAIAQILQFTQLDEPADIIKFAAVSFHHFFYMLSRMNDITIIRIGGNNA